MSMSTLEGFALVNSRAARRQVARIAPMKLEARISVSRWLLEQIGVKSGATQVSVMRKGNTLAITAGKTSSVDNSYSKHRVRIQLPKDIFIPGPAFNCRDVTVEGKCAFIRVPLGRLLSDVSAEEFSE